MKNLTIAMVLAISLSLLLIPEVSLAKRGGDDSRHRYYGMIQSKPVQELQGEWVIGGQTITTSPGTEFDQTEGALAVGSCAKVDFRNGRVHEIDSEPLRDC